MRRPVFGVAPAGVDLAQMFLAPTYAYKLAPRHAVGISAILAYQRFEAKGLQGFGNFSSDPANLTNNDHANSYGAGVRVGYLGELTDWLSVGASYQSRISMSSFDKYSGLFAEKGGFDIPQTFTGGIAVKPADKLTVALDVQWINYESVKSVGNDFLPNLALSPLGTTSGAGFGWHDMTVYKAGLQYEAGKDWVLRAATPTVVSPSVATKCSSTSWPRASWSTTSRPASRAPSRRARPSTSRSSARSRSRSRARTTSRRRTPSPSS